MDSPDTGTASRTTFRATGADTVRRVKDRSARAIYEAVREDLVAFDEPADDISLVVIKRM